jgi:hypothetical protein
MYINHVFVSECLIKTIIEIRLFKYFSLIPYNLFYMNQLGADMVY